MQSLISRFTSGIATRLCAVAALACVSTSPWAQTVTAFNDFGSTGQGFTTTSSWAVAGPNTSGGYYENGFQFQSSATGVLSSITFAAKTSDPTSSLTLNLYSDAGNTIGSLLATTSASFSMPSGATSILVNFNQFAQAAPTLQAGASYWLEASTTGSQVIGWLPTTAASFNSQAVRTGPTDTFSYIPSSTRTITHSPTGTFSVSVSPVPEPSEFALMAAGLVALIAIYRRRQT